MTGMEAAGELATGGMMARAVEPHAGERTGDAAPGQLCLNCGTTLTGPFCHSCGQQAHVHRTIGAIGHDILHSVLHFDGKLWRTLPMLLWRPGELTRRYIEGERARFVSPMALFLFSVFTMFAVFSFVGLSPPTDIDAGRNKVAMEMAQARGKLEAERKEALADLANPDLSAAAKERRRARIAEYDRDLAALAKAAPVIGGASPANVGFKTNWKLFDKGVAKMNANPGLALYKLQTNSYKFSWLLIPLSLPFVWLLFAWRRQYHGYDHAVFVTYSISFMSMLFTAVSLLALTPVDDFFIALIAIAVPPLHLYRHLRGAYPSTRLRTLLRLVVLLFFMQIVIILFVMTLLLLGAMG